MNTQTVPVTDNHGYAYEARVLHAGDSYGNGATWSESEPGVTIDGNAPGTWYAATLATRDWYDGSRLALDYGQGWFLDFDSTRRVVEMARLAVEAAS